MIAALKANYEACLGWSDVAPALSLMAACIPASLGWDECSDRLEGAQRETAEAIGRLRRDDYRKTTSLFMPLLQEAMSNRRIRPRKGVTAEALIALMHALLDGALLRSAVDPNLLTPDLVATAMYELGLALSEKGSYHEDPRRPADDPNNLFDQVLKAAEVEWRDNGTVSLSDIGQRDDLMIPPEVIRLLFASEADLADSVIRSIVISGSASDTTVRTALTLDYLRDTLHRLNRAAAELPQAIVLLHDKPVRGSRILLDLERDLTGLLASVPRPEHTAQQVISLCLEGPASWHAIETILDLVPPS